jgi:hypothetical protein
LDGTSRASARDEIEDEQMEAQLRLKLNKDFQTFVKRVEEVSNQAGAEIEFDIPYLIIPTYLSMAALICIDSETLGFMEYQQRAMYSSNLLFIAWLV